mgnify:CR=1 FL=1
MQIIKYILFISQLFYLFPIFSSQKTNQKSYEKAFAAGLMGSGLCFVKQGKYDKESFIFNVEKGMTEKGYNLEILSNDNVQKAARLIESQLGSECKESNLKDEKFRIDLYQILD